MSLATNISESAGRMSQFDARDFVKASHARRRRKIISALGIMAAAAASAALWAGLMSFDWRTGCQENRPYETTATGLVNADNEPLSLRAALGPDTSAERQAADRRPDALETWLLRPTLDAEPAAFTRSSGSDRVRRRNFLWLRSCNQAGVVLAPHAAFASADLNRLQESGQSR